MTVGRVRLALGVACASAMSLALGAVQSPWGKSHQPRYGPAVGVVAPVNPAPLQRALPDEVGGIVSSHLCVRVKPGVVVARLADGTWSMHRHGAQPDAMNAGFADAQPAQDEIALRGVLAQHQVTDIRPFVNHQFRRADLAAKYGLDRTWIAHVAPGADVVATNAALAQFPGLIEFSELDRVGSLAGVPNDPSFNLQWDMHNTGQIVAGVPGTPDADIDAPEAWDVHAGSSATVIAILDTGVQANHPDLNGKVLPGVDSRGAFGPGNWGSDTSDLNGHGTHCAGVAAARGNDGIGVAGTNWNAAILAMRVTDAVSGAWNSLDVSEGVIYAVDTGNADVISMSLQSYAAAMSVLENALAYAYDSGTLPVAAAGNIPASGAGHVAWPARYLKCMAIAATTNTDARWFDSSSSGSCDGPEVDVAAPGKNIFNIWRLSGYQFQTGTSMAAPHVAGLAALLMSHNPSLTVPEIENLIRNTAEDVNAGTNPGFDNFLGFGRVNVLAALQAAGNDCPADIVTTGGSANVVNIDDLLAVISAWGPCPAPPAACPANINNSGASANTVNIDDLLAVISAWGACP